MDIEIVNDFQILFVYICLMGWPFCGCMFLFHKYGSIIFNILS